MQAVRSGARLEHVPVAFSLSLLPSLSHSTQQTPPGAPAFGRSLISEHSPLICSLQPGRAARSADWGPAAAGSSSHLLLGSGSSLDPAPIPCAAAWPGHRDPCCLWSSPSTAENEADVCPFGCQWHHRAQTLNISPPRVQPGPPAPPCTLLHPPAPSCILLHSLAPSCTLLHPPAPSCILLLLAASTPWARGAEGELLRVTALEGSEERFPRMGCSSSPPFPPLQALQAEGKSCRAQQLTLIS